MREFKVPSRRDSLKGASAKFKVGERRQERAETVRPLRLSEIKTSTYGRISSGIEELDRVLGGGFIPGEIVLLAGEPGIGKSTLLLKLGSVRDLGPPASPCEALRAGEIIYVSGEESPEQIKIRAERLGVRGENILVMGETQVERVIEGARELVVSCESGCEGEGKGERNPQPTTHPRPTTQNLPIILIIDSIQTLWSEEIEGSPGSISQVKGCTQKLIESAKKSGIAVILIGQINKEGEIAGPMMLSHMVDCVLFLEGERFTELRLLRGLKNRFGPTDEVGVFKMTDKGMEEVKNPSELFLEGFGGDGEFGGKTGAVTVCAMEGTRPMLLEIQALVTQSSLPIPRRVVLGLDYNRVLLIIAVLQKILHLPLYNQEIIVKVGGGFKVLEPAADLGIAMSIVSSFRNKPVKPKACAFGEVGLIGEIRRVNGEEKRIKEAKKLGFTDILSSSTVSDLQEAVRVIS